MNSSTHLEPASNREAPAWGWKWDSGIETVGMNIIFHLGDSGSDNNGSQIRGADNIAGKDCTWRVTDITTCEGVTLTCGILARASIKDEFIRYGWAMAGSSYINAVTMYFNSAAGSLLVLLGNETVPAVHVSGLEKAVELHPEVIVKPIKKSQPRTLALLQGIRPRLRGIPRITDVTDPHFQLS